MTRLLIVDDNEQNLYMLQVLLTGHGYEVLSAINGAEALEKARLDPPDMVVADILMPVMDGFALCREWKGDDKLKEIPFVFYTATYTGTKDEEFALSLGADLFIRKPMDPEEFINTIDGIIRDAKNGELELKKPAPKEEEDVFKLYSERLVSKLEKKMVDLEREVAKQKQLEKELRQSEKRLHILFNYAPDAYYLNDLKGEFLDGNIAAEELTGYDRKELIGHSFLSLRLLSPTQLPKAAALLAKNVMGKPTGPDEFTLTRKDGNRVTVDIRTFPVKILDKNVVLGIARDITEKKQAAEEKERLEAQLRQAQKLETIGTLAGGIAHDFNNILTPIFGYITLAQMDVPLESPARAKLEHVEKAANRAKDLVQQILVFSRQVEQERRPVQIHLVIKEALKLLQASLPSTIEMRQNVDPRSGMVLADPTHIHQVLMNLCTNAYSAMRESGGVLEVNLGPIEVDAEFARLHPNLQEGPHIQLTVSDTGHGMDRETVDRIFEPFFTTKEIGEGTGLGLSVVHGIVVSHSGEITVYSEPGEGTTFHVYLPRLDSGAEQEVQKAETILEGSERILFIDDEEEIAQMGKEMLESFGYDVTIKTVSADALEEFSAHPDDFDLVITDQTMPRMTGVELAGELMSIRPDIPMILTSGFSETIIAEKSKELGIREFVLKPFVASDLSRTIRRVLDEEQKEGE